MSGEGFENDPEARELAERLARTDFSADSRVRASLRARLLAGRGAERPGRFRPAAALAFAAALVVFALPFLTKEPAEPGPSFPRGEQGLPVLPGRLSAAAAAAPPVFETAPARVVERADGRRSLSWSVGGATYVFESRRATLDDIFQRPTL